MVYKLTEKNLAPFYQKVAAETRLRVLVYNGDTDPSINSFLAQNWSVDLLFICLFVYYLWIYLFHGSVPRPELVRYLFIYLLLLSMHASPPDLLWIRLRLITMLV